MEENKVKINIESAKDQEVKELAGAKDLPKNCAKDLVST